MLSRLIIMFDERRQRMKHVLMIALLMCASVGQALAEEITLFNSDGAAIAYIDTDEMTVYLWEGQPVAYLEKGSVWGFNGDHLGWFTKGIIRDHDGYAVGCIKDAVSMLYKLEPLKGLKKLKPLKSLQKLEPLKPLDKDKWSTTPLSLFLAGES
jgi:hypothetical protein